MTTRMTTTKQSKENKEVGRDNSNEDSNGSNNKDVGQGQGQ